jgi:hypothetical protein
MRLLELDDLTSSYTKAHPEAGFFLRLPRSSRLQLRCRGRITRHSDKAPIWATRRRSPTRPLEIPADIAGYRARAALAREGVESHAPLVGATRRTIFR